MAHFEMATKGAPVAAWIGDRAGRWWDGSGFNPDPAAAALVEFAPKPGPVRGIMQADVDSSAWDDDNYILYPVAPDDADSLMSDAPIPFAIVAGQDRPQRFPRAFTITAKAD